MEKGYRVTTRTATCACGGLTATCEGEPPMVSLCNCLNCQRRTGSVFGVAARYPRDAVAAAGPRSNFTLTSDSGATTTFSFCPTCGGTVFWEPAGSPDVVYVAVGAFADPTFPMPMRTVYDERRHPWFTFEAASRL